MLFHLLHNMHLLILIVLVLLFAFFVIFLSLRLYYSPLFCYTHILLYILKKFNGYCIFFHVRLFFISKYSIVFYIGNENKQMCSCHLYIKGSFPWDWRWCYDRSYFIKNNIFTFICFDCRNYYSICLNYILYIFKQIDNKKTHL